MRYGDGRLSGGLGGHSGIEQQAGEQQLDAQRASQAHFCQNGYQAGLRSHHILYGRVMCYSMDPANKDVATTDALQFLYMASGVATTDAHV